MLTIEGIQSDLRKHCTALPRKLIMSGNCVGDGRKVSHFDSCELSHLLWTIGWVITVED